MTPIEVFRASARHADLVGGLLYDFNTEFDTPGPTAQAFATRFAQLLTRDDVLVLVSGSPEEPTGFAFLTLRPSPYYDGPIAQLEELYVRPPLRDRGIGTALLTSALQLMRERGSGEMQINVDEVDLDTRRFYERHGFRTTDGGTDERMLCYVQEL